ncbi:MAG: hypothetical protein WBP45_06590 [Daejeonella sp.]
MMKTIKLTLIAFLMLTAFTNCKKDKKDDVTPVVPVTIEGAWTGKLNNDDDYIRHFLIETTSSNNKILTVKNGSNVQIASGTWTLEGTNFTAVYTHDASYGGAKHSAKATFNSTTGKLNDGTLGLNSSYTDLGTWSMTKQ